MVSRIHRRSANCRTNAEPAAAASFAALVGKLDYLSAGEIDGLPFFTMPFVEGESLRTRIERDLHDGVQPRLVSVGMTLGLAQQKVDDDPAAAKALIAEAHTSTKAAITELRQLARGIHASVLDDRGLDAALSALAVVTHDPTVAAALWRSVRLERGRIVP